MTIWHPSSSPSFGSVYIQTLCLSSCPAKVTVNHAHLKQKQACNIPPRRKTHLSGSDVWGGAAVVLFQVVLAKISLIVDHMRIWAPRSPAGRASSWCGCTHPGPPMAGQCWRGCFLSAWCFEIMSHLVVHGKRLNEQKWNLPTVPWKRWGHVYFSKDILTCCSWRACSWDIPRAWPSSCMITPAFWQYGFGQRWRIPTVAQWEGS